MRADWHDRFESLQRGAKRLARVDAEGGPPVANAKKALELALLREELQGTEAALPYLRAALDAHPSDEQIRFSLARVLLECNREEGLDVLKPLFDRPAEIGARAHGLACAFHRRAGRGPMACRHLQEALRRTPPQAGSLEERE